MSSPVQEDVCLLPAPYISSFLLWNQELNPYEIHVSNVEEIV